MTAELAKQAAAKVAANLMQPDTVVGLGTGTTAELFIRALAARIHQGLSLRAVVPSSHRSLELAKKLALPVQDINQIPFIDVTVDGADEIDSMKRMIKGGGGAHVREKVLASASREMIVIVDESKLVPSIGVGKLPIEVLLFGFPFTCAALERLGYFGKQRVREDGSLYITENGNILYDVTFPSPPKDPRKDHEQMIHVPGVVETGFFFDMAGRVVIGYKTGRVEIQ